MAVLIDHVQELESAAGGGDIELVVQRTHVIGRSARSRSVGMVDSPSRVTRRGELAAAEHPPADVKAR